MRSSSTAWPTDSWIWSAAWLESRITVVTPSGQAGADSSAWACSAISAALATRSSPRTSSQPCVPYCPRTPGYERRWVSPSPMAVASTTAPHSTMRWSMRLPSLEANHFSVSHTCDLACASATPASVAAFVAATRRSARSPTPTSSSGCSTHVDDHEATSGGTGASSRGGPGTRAEARATAVAPAPAARAAASVSSGVAWNPHDDPSSARTPMPAVSAWVRSSTTPLRAAIVSCRTTITRASAYRAPAASAASTADDASSIIRGSYGAPR